MTTRSAYDSARALSEGLRAIRAGSGRVPLLVTESVLPDADIYPPIAEWRSIMATKRRVVAAHWSRFREDAETLRSGMATGKYDAYLLMPRGARDEEFHTAITELLSDWGSTVADPEVESTRVVAAFSRVPIMARSVRDVSTTIYGNPADIDVDKVVDLVVVGAGPAGLAAAVYGSSEGWRPW